ncbi:hypothetical protein [Kitasatospora sp. NPDC087315]|uniref:hypothetical protein n=1 Tax=Kitasatospora sp. NPDC087315 TaxID=3364069 RepID=UPI00380D9737
MTPGTVNFLIGAAFVALLALAIATVALGALATLRMPHPGERATTPPPPPITRHGRWELRQLPDGTTEYAWIARQAGHYGPETGRPSAPSATSLMRSPP